MKRILIVLAFPLLLLACKAGEDTGTLTPAHAVLFGCESFAVALDQINKPENFNKMNDATLNIVVKARDSVKPLCSGPAPNITSSVKDTAIDSGVRVLQAVLVTL